MPTYNIERLTRGEIFGGRLIAPMRQWLKRQRQETKGYNQNADMAIITHYLQNKDIPAGQQLEAEALRLMTEYYRATHTELAPDAPVDQEAAENLFAAIFEAPVYQHFRNNHAFTFVDLFAGIGGFKLWHEPWCYAIWRHQVANKQRPYSGRNRCVMRRVSVPTILSGGFTQRLF